MPWKRVYRTIMVADFVRAGVCVVLFAVALMTGYGARSFYFLGAAVVWIALAHLLRLNGTRGQLAQYAADAGSPIPETR